MFFVCILLMSIRSDQYIITFSLADRSIICNGWKYILFVYTTNEQTWGNSFRFTLTSVHTITVLQTCYGV